MTDWTTLDRDLEDVLVGLTKRFAMAMVLIFALFPIYWMFVVSMRPREEAVSTNPNLLLDSLYLENYVLMWQRFPLVDYFINSLIIALTTTALALFIASLAAYSFTRFSFPGKATFGGAILGTQMIPGVLILLPMYLLFVNVQTNVGLPMTNTYHGVIFVYTTFAIPFAIWMLRGYFANIPASLEDAARVDGCTRFQALIRIVLPLAAPGIAATGMFVFLTAFNEVLFASVLASSDVTPFAIGIQRFETQTQTYWGQMMAASTVATIPLVVIFILFQKPIVDGLTSGSVKQ
ncbi:carbohydrate ABC transporter permease [Natrarchaeobius chitinivorans]|uniref:Carbohydrate ABC transporter permease n=1 Tax=Natrarchaeobius chitinivorans TaxID=1679083 RepID=A0A3N6PFU5_NATCH|nr:carbohydrate ABC transporter permease [Natrarchaeobius chitinivorans]RQG96525.1 carbohydrate ABC transporter permease [Natrarchaeobius chitinivorans]